MYDVSVRPFSAWRPSIVYIGTSYNGTPPYNSTMTGINIPLWQPALLLGAAAAAVGGRARARRHARTLAALSICPTPHCGYSRAGLPADAPCPECGK